MTTYSHLYSLVFTSLSEISPQSFHPLSPPTPPRRSRRSVPLRQREQARNREGAEWKETDRKNEIQEAQAAFHFRCLVYAALPHFHGSGKLRSFPLEAHRVHSLRPCNAVHGPQ